MSEEYRIIEAEPGMPSQTLYTGTDMDEATAEFALLNENIGNLKLEKLDANGFWVDTKYTIQEKKKGHMKVNEEGHIIRDK